MDEATESARPSTNLKNPAQVEALNQLAIDTNALLAQNAVQAQAHQLQSSTGSFSISDFLVSGLQSKAWEDWQLNDELNLFATGMDSQDFTSDLAALPFGFEPDSMWDTTTGATNVATDFPADQAYDEFVFDLGPSNFAVPETVNVADLIVGPNSMAPTVPSLELVSPSMPTNFNDYEDLALANLYGFTEHDDDLSSSDSDLGSDLSEASSSDDEGDDEDEGDMEDELNSEESIVVDDQLASDLTRNSNSQSLFLDDRDSNAAHVMSPATVDTLQDQVTQQMPQRSVVENLNKRRMEELLAIRISNDLGPEHMAGLLRILKGTGDQETEDDDEEEVEVDLSHLDEATLVEVYQYVEACCIQTMASILAAEEQEHKKAVAEAAKAKKEQGLLLKKEWTQRTPELSPNHSASSAPPSPLHSSSYNSSRCGCNYSKKRSATVSTSCTIHYHPRGVEEQTEAQWMTVQHKPKRKRMNNNSPVCVGGGGTSKGRRKRISGPVAVEQGQFDEEMDIGEDDEIDIVGF
ncbi:hypothetical protein BX616_001410 [Lobosporangium transversale]|nr:hypothetical protein BX616_001410 [Lobosporangium transversale]